MIPMVPSDTVERYLRTGEHALGESSVRGREAPAHEAALRRILGRVLRYRADRAPLRRRRRIGDVHRVVTDRVAPMVHGLLGPDAGAAMAAIPQRVVVVEAETFDERTADLSLCDAWALANVLLDDLGAPPLADDVPAIDGLVSAGRAWVPAGALGPSRPFTDVLVHEVAHLLHEVPRGDLDLAPANAPLVRVARADRETWAYSCEVWAWIERQEARQRARTDLVRRYLSDHRPADHRVDISRLTGVLEAAAQAENDGWKQLTALADPEHSRVV